MKHPLPTALSAGTQVAAPRCAGLTHPSSGGAGRSHVLVRDRLAAVVIRRALVARRPAGARAARRSDGYEQVSAVRQGQRLRQLRAVRGQACRRVGALQCPGRQAGQRERLVRGLRQEGRLHAISPTSAREGSRDAAAFPSAAFRASLRRSAPRKREAIGPDALVPVARDERLVLPVTLSKVAPAPEDCRLVAPIREKLAIAELCNEVKSDRKAIASC